MSTVYLVTGANRGIGLGLVTQLASRPDVKVYATARNPSQASVLQELQQKYNNIRILQLAVESVSDNQAVAARIQEEEGKIDIIFANAGAAATDSGAIATTKPGTFTELFNINTVGTINLFQATYSLLERSTRPNGGVFLGISTVLGSIGNGLDGVKGGAYGTSKAALNYVIKRISIEHPSIIALAVHPGLVKTSMGQMFGDSLGVPDITAIGAIDVETSVAGLVKIVDTAAKESSGTFQDYSGKSIGW